MDCAKLVLRRGDLVTEAERITERLAEIKNDVKALDKTLLLVGYDGDLDAIMPRQKRNVIFGNGVMGEGGRLGWEYPTDPLTEEEHAKNNLPDIFARWLARDKTERDRPRTAQSFCVPREDIEAANYDLSLNRYQEIKYEEVDYPAPEEIIADLRKIEDEISEGLKALEGMLR